MNTINADQLLSQIRTLGRDLQPATIESLQPPVKESGFGNVLKDSLDAVNEAQKTAGALKVDFENGTTNKSLAEVMIAGQKANLAFRAVTEVRNKVVTAYQDIMNMPV